VATPSLGLGVGPASSPKNIARTNNSPRRPNPARAPSARLGGRLDLNVFFSGRVSKRTGRSEGTGFFFFWPRGRGNVGEFRGPPLPSEQRNALRKKKIRVLAAPPAPGVVLKPNKISGNFLPGNPLRGNQGF